MKIMLVQLQREHCSIIYLKMVLKEVSRGKKLVKKEVNRKEDCPCAGKSGDGRLKTIEKELYFRMKVRL